jgi:demethylspheroidene O-methyltransferase
VRLFPSNCIVALPEFLIRLRNRLLTDPRFISFVQSLPGGRLIARKKSQQLFDILAGFTYSQILSACVSLKVFERVGRDGTSLAELTRATGLSADRCLMLVKGAESLSLLQRSGQTVFLGELGAALLAQPWIMRLIEHHVHFYSDLSDPVALLKTGKATGDLQRYWAYDDSAGDKARYSALMAASQKAVSEQVLAAYDFGRHNQILDVGGGAGAFLTAVGARYPKLGLHLFDLPAVAALVSRQPVTGQAPAIQAHGGDFRRDSLPSGMDLVTLIRVVHDHDDDAVLALFRNIRAAVIPGTTLLIAEPLSGHPSTARVADAYFNFYFTAMGQGRTRSPAEIAQIADQSGFGAMRQWPTQNPLIAGVVSLLAQ